MGNDSIAAKKVDDLKRAVRWYGLWEFSHRGHDGFWEIIDQASRKRKKWIDEKLQGSRKVGDFQSTGLGSTRHWIIGTRELNFDTVLDKS